MATALTIIEDALCDLGTIRPGEVPSVTVQADCLSRLNQRLSAHSIEQTLAQTQKHGFFNLQSGVTRYTFGVGGTFSTASRPEKLTAWRATYGPFASGGMALTFEELQAASRDGLGTTSSLPTQVGADTAFPLINVGVFPIPSSAPGVIELTYWTALTQFAAVSDVATFPDGWLDFLHFDLAMALLPRYGRQGADASALAANAAAAKAKIAELNRVTPQQAPQ